MANIKWTLEKIIKFIESENYEFIEYVSRKGKETRVKVWCKNPKHEPYEVCFNDFKGNKNRKGRRCSQCTKWKGCSYEYIKEQFEKEGYILLSEYKNAYTDLEIRCSKNHEWKTTYSNFQQGHRCPYCMAEDRRYEYREVKGYIESFGYKLLSTEYKNNKCKLSIRCPKGHEFKMGFSSFKNQGQRCPICNESKGERRVREYLENNNINFTPQIEYEDLLGLGRGNLSYDFYLPQYNLLIEYQGEFHDGSVTGSYQKTFDFDRQQEHDKRKKQYSIDNNIELLEIWYWDFDNIENILNKELKLK